MRKSIGLVFGLVLATTPALARDTDLRTMSSASGETEIGLCVRPTPDAAGAPGHGCRRTQWKSAASGTTSPITSRESSSRSANSRVRPSASNHTPPGCQRATASVVPSGLASLSSPRSGAPDNSKAALEMRGGSPNSPGSTRTASRPAATMGSASGPEGARGSPAQPASHAAHTSAAAHRGPAPRAAGRGTLHEPGALTDRPSDARASRAALRWSHRARDLRATRDALPRAGRASTAPLPDGRRSRRPAAPRTHAADA